VPSQYQRAWLIRSRAAAHGKVCGSRPSLVSGSATGWVSGVFMLSSGKVRVRGLSLRIRDAPTDRREPANQSGIAESGQSGYAQSFANSQKVTPVPAPYPRWALRSPASVLASYSQIGL
jgi:hypothetical protein